MTRCAPRNGSPGVICTVADLWLRDSIIGIIGASHPRTFRGRVTATTAGSDATPISDPPESPPTQPKFSFRRYGRFLIGTAIILVHLQRVRRFVFRSSRFLFIGGPKSCRVFVSSARNLVDAQVRNYARAACRSRFSDELSGIFPFTQAAKLTISSLDHTLSSGAPR
jgi:hypothetical protein